jgi:hypothetical protein
MTAPRGRINNYARRVKDMLKRVALVAGLVGALGICAAPAGAQSNNCNKSGQCVFSGGCPMPFADDQGKTTCNKSAEGCEAKIGGLVGKTVAAVIKCHAKQAQAAFKTANGKPTSFDEEACENTAINGPKGFVASAQAAQAKDTTGACSCVGVNVIASLIGGILDGNNGLVFCDGSDPIDQGGDDAGTFDHTNATGFKAMVAAGTCVSKLVAAWEKCHATFAKNVLKNKVDPTDPGHTDEICEGDGDNSNPKGAIEAFNACMAKLQAKGLPACTTSNIGTILGLTKNQLDGSNGLVYCASPSGAFVQ